MSFPPNGLDEILACYGDPRAYLDDTAAWEAKILVAIRVPPDLLVFAGHPVSRVRCHHLVAEPLGRAFCTIHEAGLRKIEYGGVYAFRHSRVRAGTLSTHCWGLGPDLNETRCPLGSGPELQDPGIVRAFETEGFTWGGRFHGRKDPMHFQLCSGY